MRDQWLLFLALSSPGAPSLVSPTADWPQFRGPGGNAVSETAVPPVAFGPSTNLLWKTPLPLGYSSPVVSADRIFVTGDEAGLETIALSRKDGRILWRRAALADRTVTIKDPSGSGRAASTPVVDGAFVYAFFGTVGLIAYDLGGTEQWRRPLLKPDPEISASPIIVDDKIIIVCDVGPGSFVEALDKKNGRSIWRTERDRMRRSVSTPFHWVNDKRDELIVSGSYWLTSYDPRTGKPNWPVAAAGRIYFISQNGVITVIDATADTLTRLAQNKMDEPTLATPALVGTHILIRTEKALYAFETAN